MVSVMAYYYYLNLKLEYYQLRQCRFFQKTAWEYGLTL